MLQDIVSDRIFAMWRNERKTQIEIAEKFHMHQSQIAGIISGKRKTGGLRIETFDKMFPNAVVHLDGECPGKASVNTNGNHNIVNSEVTSGTPSGILDAILADIMSSDRISSDDKVAVYNIINAHKG